MITAHFCLISKLKFILWWKFSPHSGEEIFIILQKSIKLFPFFHTVNNTERYFSLLMVYQLQIKTFIDFQKSKKMQYEAIIRKYITDYSPFMSHSVKLKFILWWKFPPYVRKEILICFYQNQIDYFHFSSHSK